MDAGAVTVIAQQPEPQFLRAGLEQREQEGW